MGALYRVPDLPILMMKSKVRGGVLADIAAEV